MAEDRFTPARERLRDAEVVAALRRGTLRSPAWLLCPTAPRRAAIEARVARGGGAFIRTVDWAKLAAQLDHQLQLPFAEGVDETDRVLAVERCLEGLASRRASLREALVADPFGVASALLSVVDALRAHGWSGDVAAVPLDGVAEGARDVVRDHIATLAAARRALEDRLAADGRLDTLARIRRATDALRGGRRPSMHALIVDGVDRLAPVERDLLRALASAGCAIDVAPWVLGWGDEDRAAPPSEAPTLRHALEVGARAVTDPEDQSVDAVRVRDPHEEAELVARWIAERVARGDAPGDFAVSVGASCGAVDRVRRALSRWGVASSGGARVSVRTTPLWQVVRASVRLAWRGLDAVDLATVLAAPGSGVWGGDRDRLLAAVRRRLPTSWRALRDLVMETFSEDEPVAEERGDNPDDEPREPGSAARIAEARENIIKVVAIWEPRGPFSRHAVIDRPRLLREVVGDTLERFVRAERFAEALVDPRDQTAWLLASQAIDAALRTALARIEERQIPLPADEPSGFLAAVESLLGAVDEEQVPPRDAGVAILEDHADARRRPRFLAVTGFVRGRHPNAPSPRLLLGLQERAALRGAMGANALPSEDEERAIAWRETQRLLALPSESVLLVMPERALDGARTEPSLTWRDLLARMHPARRATWERDGVPSAAAWLARELPDGARSEMGRRAEAVARVGRGDVSGAVALARPLAAADLATRDLFAARFRPDRGFAVGDLVRAQLAEAVFTPRDLESALTCRYRFLASSLLGLRPARFARAPSLSARDRQRVLRDALRRLDARLAAGEPERGEDAEDALDEAILAVTPWVTRGGSHVAYEELRRTSRTFLLRYLTLRRQWGVARGEDLPEEEQATVVPVTVGPSRTLQVRVDPPRVEVRATTAGDIPLAVDFTLRRLDGIARLRDLGLDLDAALAPLAAEARYPGASPGAFVRLSLARPVGDALAARGAETTEDDRVAPFETTASATAVSVERHRRIEDHRDVALAQLGEVLEALDRDDAEFAPHDEGEHERLKDAGARTCDACDARLACRFKMVGS